MAVLYQVVEQGRQSALVCENTDGITDLHALLAQAAANMKHTGGGFMEALSRAGTELGVPFRQVLADEADALSHDLGHGGAAEQRILIDLDSGRIRVEYDTGPTACERVWRLWLTISQRQPRKSRIGS